MVTSTADRAGLIEQVEKATAHLLDSAQDLTDADVRQPSLLPGWSRGHVLTHVARNADSYTRALTGVRTGGDTSRYTSVEDRDAAIDAGAGRSAAELVADVRTSHERLLAACQALPDDAWDTEIRQAPGRRGYPAAGMPWGRLKEVLVHHVDLDAGFTPAHWPADFVTRCLDDVVRDFASRDDAPPVELVADDTGRRLGIRPDPQVKVTGPEPALLAWLTGRVPGDGLTVEPPGPLPALPDWS
jgi:maleylpyruvate isomerase